MKTTNRKAWEKTELSLIHYVYLHKGVMTATNTNVIELARIFKCSAAAVECKLKQLQYFYTQQGLKTNTGYAGYWMQDIKDAIKDEYDIV